MQIEWMNIEGYDGEYQVSLDGRVRSFKGGRNIELRPSMGTKYLHVVLAKDGKTKTHSVHRLVALAFIGNPPDSTMVCCHSDGNKLNNHFSNLRWDTQSGNLSDRIIHGTDPSGARSSTNKYSHEMVGMVIRGEVTSGQAKSLWGMSQPTYSAIRLGKTWKKHPDRIKLDQSTSCLE